MPKSKSNNADEIEMRYTLTERLKELINETGGDKKFVEKLDEINTKGSTDGKLVTRWQDPEKDIQLQKIYLIAMACNVSVDWLLGLSTEKYRKEKVFKRPTTYGDALSILNNLIKIDVIGITDSHPQSADEDISADDDVTRPNYIQIKDKHLIDLFKDLYRSQELSEGQFTDVWKKMLKLEMNKPIQQYDGKPNHNDMRSKQANINKTAVPVKILNDDALKKQVKEQLETLKNDLSDKEFGEKINVNKSTVHGWFKPVSHLPETYALYKIAKKYDVSADCILGMEESDCKTVPWEDGVFTYGSVLSMLKDLIDKGTIGFVQPYDPPYYLNNPDDDDDCNDNYTPVIDDLLIIDDLFLFCLLLKQNIGGRYTTDALKNTFKESFDECKGKHLLSFKKETRYGSYKTMRSNSSKILNNLWDGKIEHDIDFDKLYKDLQRLSDSMSDK